jgi:hypothetical protein
MNFEGNIIPQSWYQHIKYTNKRGTYADLLAISLLADIIYWYRPIEVRDEATGAAIGWKKKFKGDLLQRSYQSYAVTFGATYNQVRAAFSLLEELGMVRLYFRSVRGAHNQILSNVMFIEPIVESIAEATYKVSAEERRRMLLPTQVEARKTKRKSRTTKSASGSNSKKPHDEIVGSPCDEIVGTYTEITSYGDPLDIDIKHKQVVAPTEDGARPFLSDEDFEDWDEWDEEEFPTVNDREENPANGRSGKKTPHPLPPLPAAERIVTVTPKRAVKPSDIKFKTNDAGWVQMPLAKRYKLARAVTMRRLEYAIHAHYSNITVGDFVDGIQLFHWKTGEVSPADPLLAARDYIFAKGICSQEGFNQFLCAIFLDTIEWLEAGGANAFKAFQGGRLVEMFLDDDVELFLRIRRSGIAR